MRKPVTRAPQADEDAQTTYLHIALDNVDAAEAYLDALFDLFDKLLENPEMGATFERAKGELSGLRVIPVSSTYRKHLVFYLLTATEIHVIRILHGSRDVETLLSTQ